MQAPIGQNMIVETHDGLTATVTSARTATLSDPANLLSLSSQTETVTINGRQVTRVWNAATHTYTDTSPEGRVTTTLLDTQGRPSQQQVGNLAATEYSYDTNGQLDGIAQGSRLTTMTYDSDGNVESVTDPADRTVSFTYDGAGRVERQVLPDTRYIDFDYDANGNLTSITPPGSAAHGFSYLPRGQVQFYIPPQLTPPLTERRTQYAYNLSGQLTDIIRPDGEDIFLDYDVVTGQLLAQVPSVGPSIAYVYDDDTGDLERVTTASGQILDYTYDNPLPKSETWSVAQNGVGIAGSVSRTYDQSYRVVSQGVNGANAISFGYDTDDLLTSAGGMTLSRSSATGLLTGTVISNATDSYSSYDGFGEVLAYAAVVNGTTLYSVSYTRDCFGRISTKSETVQGTGATYGYDYDQAGRLTDVTKNSTLIGHYEYDSNGNRVADADSDTVTTENLAGAVTSTTYDAQDRLLSIDQGMVTTNYAYTDNGELSTKTVGSAATSYTYDLFGNLRSVTLPSTDVIDYLIDGYNPRVDKVVNGTPVQGFLYDGQLKIVAELNGSNQVVSRFVYASKPNVPDYMMSGGVTYRLISDHLGSVRLVVNASTGSVAQRLDYDEFGNVLNDTSPGFQPFGFAGGLYDPDTGLVRFGVRDYDPFTGRWTAKDPIGFVGGTNPYSYVQSEPINHLDVLGTFTVADSALVGSVSGLVAGGLHSVIRPFKKPFGASVSECRQACYEQYFLGGAVTVAGASLLIGGITGFGAVWANYVGVVQDLPELISYAKDAAQAARLATGGAAFAVSYGTAVLLSCELQCSYGQ